MSPQPIRYKAKANHDLVTHVLACFRSVAWIHFGFSVPPCDICVKLYDIHSKSTIRFPGEAQSAKKKQMANVFMPTGRMYAAFTNYT